MLRPAQFVFLGVVLMLSTFVCAQAPLKKAPLSTLPEGPGKKLIIQYCANCHEMKRIEEDQGTKAEWITRVRRMIRRGAVIPPEKIEPIGEFLSRALPPRFGVGTKNVSPITTAVSEVALRPVQIWVRGAGPLQKDNRTVVALLHSTAARTIRSGDRVRAFALSSRSSMYQARVTSVESRVAGTQVNVQLTQQGHEPNEMYLLEIIAEPATLLSIPNEAIIEEGDRQLVYVQDAAGKYAPREIKTGLQGELYTEVVSGLRENEQVVTFGSFFIDAEYKLKSTASAASNDRGALQIDYQAADQPHAGINSVAVMVRDQSGKPVTNGDVKVTYSMAAMPSMNMPEMRDSFPLAHRKNGTYGGDVNLSMAGTWQVTVAVSRNGQAVASKEFSVIAK